MAGISNAQLEACKPGIWQAAKEGAHEHRIPWRLDELRRAALRGVQAMLDEGRYDARLGPSFEQQAWRWMKQQVYRKGCGFRQSELSGEAPEPSDAQIREALETFSAEEWGELVEGFARRDVDILHRYLQSNLDRAAHILGAEKVRAVFNATSTQGLILGLDRLVQSGYKTVTPTDPMWAALFWRRARDASLRHEPRSKMRTTPESGSYSGIAASLSLQGRKVHGVQVKRWLDRLREYPEWRDFLDRRGPKPEVGPYFWHKIADPKGYERRWRPLEQDRG